MEGDGLFGLFGTHVYAMSYNVRHDNWCVVEWSSQGLDIRVVKGELIDRILSGVLMLKGDVISIREGPRMPRRTFPRLKPAYCVSVTLDLVRLDRPLVLSPRHLYRALIQAGGKSVRETKPELAKECPYLQSPMQDWLLTEPAYARKQLMKLPRRLLVMLKKSALASLAFVVRRLPRRMV